MPETRLSPGTCTQMALVAALSLAAAAVSHALRSQPLDLRYAWSNHVLNQAAAKGMATVSTAEARVIADTFSHVILDARRESDYLEGHLPGAMNLPAAAFDDVFPNVAPLLSPEQPILVYCSGQDCDESILLGDMLMKSGFTNIALYAGGVTAWEEEGHSLAR